MGKKYLINGIEFKTKKSLKEYVDNIKKKYPLGQSIRNSNFEDFEFLCEFFKLHYEYDIKKGVGIQDIIVERNTNFQMDTCFYIVRLDGSKIDISVKVCLDGTNKDTPESLLTIACRNVTRPYLQQFRENYFRTTSKELCICPITGIQLTWNNSDTDHAYPQTFKQIVSDFIEVFDIDITKIQYTNTSGVDNTVLFKEKSLADLFYNYHATVANLRVVSREANRKILRQMYG